MSIFFVCGACALQARGDLRRLERFWNSTIHNSEIEITFEFEFLPKNGIFSSLTKNKTKQIEEEEEKLVLSRYVRHDWSDDDDERNAAEKPDDREKRFFVGFDREERRYLFHTHSSEIEFD